MKKAIYPVLAAILLLSLCACGHQQDDSPQVSPAVSAVSSMRAGPPDYTTEEHDANGKLIRRNHHSGYDDRISSYYIFEYDGDRLIRETQYSNPNFICDYTEYTYDADGRLLEIYHYDTHFGSSYIMEHDTNGNCVRATSYEKDGSIRSRSEYEHDDHGNLLRQSLYLGDGSHNSTLINEYNDAGQLIRRSRYSADGSLFTYEIFEYDGETRVGSTLYFADGTKVPVAEYADPTV